MNSKLIVSKILKFGELFRDSAIWCLILALEMLIIFCTYSVSRLKNDTLYVETGLATTHSNLFFNIFFSEKWIKCHRTHPLVDFLVQLAKFLLLRGALKSILNMAFAEWQYDH